MEKRRHGYNGKCDTCLSCLVDFTMNLRDLIMTTRWKSCIWLSPKTATLMVAAYYIILSVIIVSLSIVGYTMINPIEVVKREDGKQAKESDEILMEGVIPARVMLAFLILTGLLAFVTNIMLVVAATQEKSQWVYIWLNTHVFILATHLLICFCNMFLELPDQTQKNVSIYGCVTNGMFTLYFLVVVNNFYTELEEQIPFGSYVENPYLIFNKQLNGHPHMNPQFQTEYRPALEGRGGYNP